MSTNEEILTFENEVNNAKLHGTNFITNARFDRLVELYHFLGNPPIQHWGCGSCWHSVINYFETYIKDLKQ